MLSNVWFPAIVNSPEEITEMVNFVRQSQSLHGCGGAVIGGSTNSTKHDIIHTIGFPDYIPNSSGKLKSVSTVR